MSSIAILICTIDGGVMRVPDMLMPEAQGVSYVVSVQYTERKWIDEIPKMLYERADVKVTCMEGRGLSRNRNNALAHAHADICMIADDDCIYTPEAVDNVRRFFDENTDVDVACFKAVNMEGKDIKRYPDRRLTLADAKNEGYFPTSPELSFRLDCIRKTGIRFDERFGLGSGTYGAGEEDVFLEDLNRMCGRIDFVPMVVVQTDGDSTGLHFLESANLQETKGAVFAYLFGRVNATWRTMKEAGWHLVHSGANPLPIIINMLKGIWTSR